MGGFKGVIQVISIPLCKDITAILLQLGKLRHGAGVWMESRAGKRSPAPQFPNSLFIL